MVKYLSLGLQGVIWMEILSYVITFYFISLDMEKPMYKSLVF